MLRYGRLYQRQISNFNAAFADAEAGELIAWSRILDEEEALCVVNGNGTQARGGDVTVDAQLNAADAAGQPWSAAGPGMSVIANSAQAAFKALHPGQAYAGPHPIGQRLPVLLRDGACFVEIRDLSASEVLVLVNRD